MKNMTCLTLTALCAALATGSALAQRVYSINGLSSEVFSSPGDGEGDNQTTLIIKSDGSCTLTNEAVQPRKSLERQVASWERYSKRNAGDEEGAVAPPPPARSATNALTSDELAAKVRAMYEQRPDFGEEEALNLDHVEVSTNSVRLVTSRAFPSLKELLSQSPYTWGPTALMLEDARAELDTNRNFRLAFTGAQNTARYAKEMSRGWKASKVKFAWKLVLPGKVISSSLPGVQDNTTWLTLDGEKPESIDAALKLIGPPIVIIAEPAGIKLDEPLESRKLVRAAWKHRKSEPDVPITEATPGFLAEPVGLTLSTIHTFPEGEKYFKDRPEGAMMGMEAPGTTVSAKLFPPKSRQIESVSGLRVKSAKDDQGRPIAAAAGSGDDEDNDNEFTSYRSGDSEKGGPVEIEIRLALPAPDAKTIDALEAEAIALTIGSWKELVLTNVQADAKKEIDLGELLPGAKMIIKKVGAKTPQKSVEAMLEGPATVSQLDLKIKSTSRQGGQSNVSDRRSTTSGNKTTRTVTVQSYEFQPNAEAKNAPITLIVRYPQDVKRERVQFKLTALDLL